MVGNDVAISVAVEQVIYYSSLVFTRLKGGIILFRFSSY